MIFLLIISICSFILYPSFPALCRLAADLAGIFAILLDNHLLVLQPFSSTSGALPLCGLSVLGSIGLSASPAVTFINNLAAHLFCSCE